jgi:hypothetical protein
MNVCKHLARGLDGSFYCKLKKRKVDPAWLPCIGLESVRKEVCYN